MLLMVLCYIFFCSKIQKVVKTWKQTTPTTPTTTTTTTTPTTTPTTPTTTTPTTTPTITRTTTTMEGAIGVFFLMEEKIWLPKDRFWEEAKSDVSCEEGCCWHFWHSNWKNPVTGKQEVPIRLEQKVRFSTTKKQNLNITSHFSQLVPLFFHLKKIEQTTPINVNELINQYAASIVVVVPDVNNKSMENAASQLQKNISQEENVKNKKKDLEQDQLFFE